jgi:hypothetical protein
VLVVHRPPLQATVLIGQKDYAGQRVLEHPAVLSRTNMPTHMLLTQTDSWGSHPWLTFTHTTSHINPVPRAGAVVCARWSPPPPPSPCTSSQLLAAPAAIIVTGQPVPPGLVRSTFHLCGVLKRVRSPDKPHTQVGGTLFHALPQPTMHTPGTCKHVPYSCKRQLTQIAPALLFLCMAAAQISSPPQLAAHTKCSHPYI